MAPRGITVYGQQTADSYERNAAPKPPVVTPPKQNDGFNFDVSPQEWLGSSAGQAFLEKYLGGIKATPIIAPRGTGISASDRLAQQKFDYERQQDAATAAKQKQTLAAYQQMLSGGGYRSGMDTLLGMIGTEGGRQTEQVNKAYQDAIANIAAGYEGARQTTGSGYDALAQYLQQNPNNPYANVQVSAGAAPDAMEQILSAYGVSADPVRAQVAAEQAASQQGAAGFQNLLNVLGASAQQSDLSRLAEAQMAQRLASERLSGEQAGLMSQASRAQADALSAIQAQLAQARLEQEAAAVARRQSIEDAIIAAGGSIPQAAVPPADVPPAAPPAVPPAATKKKKPGSKNLAVFE